VRCESATLLLQRKSLVTWPRRGTLDGAAWDCWPPCDFAAARFADVIDHQNTRYTCVTCFVAERAQRSVRALASSERERMYVCVECGAAVNHVYREFSKGNIRLTKCV
jgi:hypothetical protein